MALLMLDSLLDHTLDPRPNKTISPFASLKPFKADPSLFFLN